MAARNGAMSHSIVESAIALDIMDPHAKYTISTGISTILHMEPT